MNKNITSIVLICALAACQQPAQVPPMSAAPLAGARIGGPFTLTDQDGKQRTYDEFAGKYRIIYFGYTSCPDVCTPDVQQLMAGLIAFEKAHPALGAKVQPIFISVDPGHDTPAVLKQFVSAFHPRLIGLTGTETNIAAVAKSFATHFEKVADKNMPTGYMVAHYQTPYLMGPDGKPIALLPFDALNSAENEGRPELVAAELEKWVH